MSLWSRITNVFRAEALNSEIDEELASHLAEAVEQGRDPADARRAFGSMLLRREESTGVRLIPWLDSLRADAIFGCRQLLKNKATSAAAILSLGLAIGACTSAFRLIDAVLLRPLPVAEPERLFVLSREGTGPDGKLASYDAFAYPAFQQMRATVKDQAELMAISYSEELDLTYNSEREPEKAHVQYVSGWMFGSLGLRPAVGRLLSENDDLKPGAHPYAVLSNDYWSRRFGRDANVIGRTFRLGDDVLEIAGVVDAPFTGTEPGTVTDVFIPSMMHAGVLRDDWTWIRILARLKPGVAVEPLRAKLHATSRAFEEERAKGFTGMSKENIVAFLSQKLILEPAAAGASGLQKAYRPALLAVSVLVALVLLIACANVANLMTAQSAARSREMALRVSIGAGRWRLVQLILVESAVLAFLAAGSGALFAWWSAPFVVSRINPPDNPARLYLPTDWRLLAFGLGLTLLVTCLFGLAPALRASTINPASALKGGSDPHSRKRLMHALIAVQAAFCVLVIFVAGLFVATFDRLSNHPTGFSADHVLALDTVTQAPQQLVFWNQVRQHLRTAPGVESVALAGWPLLGGGGWNGFVSINGAPPGPELAFFLNVSPDWLDTMKLALLDGRDLRPNEGGVALVNETFVREFFKHEPPLGKLFAKGNNRFQIIGVVRDAPYKSIRGPIPPVAYVPFETSRAVRAATFIVRTSTSSPPDIASILRREVPRARPEFRVSNIRSQADLVRAQTVRERLLAMLALFFALVALLLAGIGLYGVLDYSVLQRRREIGIRMALGARAAHIAGKVTASVFSMVLAGAVVGIALGLASVRYIETLLYQVQASDVKLLVLPWLAILTAALLAALPAVIRAVRIDPVITLRSE